jgi:acyl-CoA synthetase (AMP-forming)/AMP-acid ligase II/surfactin synthase thioesterase subunit/acyl carrier protein
MPFATLFELLRQQAENLPQAKAILCPDRAPLTYSGLFLQVGKIVAELHGLGISSMDRIAVVLPNGPEMALAFLATACTGTCAPLNPLYTADEYEFYLCDLKAKALLLFQNDCNPARSVAKKLGIQTIEISISESKTAGAFSIYDAAESSPSTIGCAKAKDTALVLHTSGTTSRPKLVPLSHENICVNALNIAASLALGGADRCLNVMPLFHIHGLVGALTATLYAGGSVVCAPGFDDAKFFLWVEEFQPTWYTAVPTMHQAILNRASNNQHIIASSPFRFIRSCSAALPPQLMSDLEKAFNTAVVEAYGMTEASHQISVNPLPPAQRKPKSVGIPTGSQVAIMDDKGAIQASGLIGEIVIKGPNVTEGYEANPSANESAFKNGWFRTGDQGYIDSEGYIFISGRIKEIINRGGEKISPREVDEVFLEHPQVAQVITFAVPHPTLGQDLAVAIVPRDKAILEEESLRKFAFERLASFKVPSKVVIVAAIPKGPTGKMQRIGLHQKLAEALTPEHVAPRNSIETTLVGVWIELLNIPKIGVTDNFFLLGGDSITAVQLITQIKSHFGVDLPLPTIFHSPTIEQLSRQVSKRNKRAPIQSLTKVSQSRGKVSLFCVPGTKGNIFTDLIDLSNALGPEYTVYGFQDNHRNPMKIESLATKYVQEIIATDPQGPYNLLGICSGAVVAFEMTQQFVSQKRNVAFFGMVEPSPPAHAFLKSYMDFLWLIFRRAFRQGNRHTGDMLRLSRDEKRMYLLIRVRYYAIHLAVRRYKPNTNPQPINLYLTRESLENKRAQRGKWANFSEAKTTTRPILGTHYSITGKYGTPISKSGMQSLADQLKSDIFPRRSKKA